VSQPISEENKSNAMTHQFMSKYLGASVHQEVFFRTVLGPLTSVSKSLGNIVSWDKNIFFQCYLST